MTETHIYNANCYNIIDGDTIEIGIDLGFDVYTFQRVRLANVDAVDRGHSNYEEATEFVSSRIKDKQIRVHTTKDKVLGEYLVTVWYINEDGEEVNLNDEMLDTKNGSLIKENGNTNLINDNDE